MSPLFCHCIPLPGPARHGGPFVSGRPCLRFGGLSDGRVLVHLHWFGYGWLMNNTICGQLDEKLNTGNDSYCRPEVAGRRHLRKVKQEIVIELLPLSKAGVNLVFTLAAKNRGCLQPHNVRPVCDFDRVTFSLANHQLLFRSTCTSSAPLSVEWKGKEN